MYVRNTHTPCQALKLAREVDPNGTRTLAVCTKLDLMDQGTDAVDLLTGKVIPVKLGIIGVVNRSQQDITDTKTIEDALRDEQVFLRRKYPTLASRNGTPYLAKTLNKLLMQHIRGTLPKLRHDITSKLNTYESHMTALGEPVENKGPALLQTLTRFSTAYCQKIEGNSRDIDTHQLSGGARICYIFHHTLSRALHGINPLEGLNRKDILHAISNAMGPRPALFVSEMAFELLVKRQIRLLLQPSLQCVELVYEELQRIIQYCLSNLRDFQRFPILRERMNAVVMGLIRGRLPVTNQMVENLISIELAYINTNHPDFVGGTRAAYESYMIAQTAKQQQVERSTSQKSSGAKLPPPPQTQQAEKQSGQTLQKGWLSSWYGGKQTGGGEGERAATGLNDISSADQGSKEVVAVKADRSDSNVSLANRPDPNASLGTASRQDFDCELIEKLISSYFLIVRKSVQDSVPKAVMHCLVNFVKEEVQSRLVSELYRTDAYDELMEESVEMIARRQEVREMVGALQKAAEILNEIRDLQFESRIVGFTDYEEFGE